MFWEDVKTTHSPPSLHRLNNSLCEVKIWCSSTAPQKTLRIFDFCLTSREWYFPELCWIRKRKTKGLQAGGGIFWCFAERDVIPRDDLFCLTVCRQVSRRLKKNTEDFVFPQKYFLSGVWEENVPSRATKADLFVRRQTLISGALQWEEKSPTDILLFC